MPVRTSQRKTLICQIVLGFLALGLAAAAQVPQLVGYQGRVTVGTVAFDGSGQFKFALVNTNGTVTYWSNDGTSVAGSPPAAAVALTVTKGIYSLLLGDPAVANMAAIPASVWSNADVRLRVWFNDGINGFQQLTPDQRLAPNGYLPDGAVTAAKIANGAVDLAGTKVTGALPINSGGTGASTAAEALAKLGASNPPRIASSLGDLYNTAPTAAGQLATVVENGVPTQYVATGTGVGAWSVSTARREHVTVSPRFTDAYAGGSVPLETVLGQSAIRVDGNPKSDTNFLAPINASQWAGKTAVASMVVVSTEPPSGTGSGPWTLAVRMGVAYTTPKLDGTTPLIAPNLGYATGHAGETGVVAHPAPTVASAPLRIKTAPFTIPANVTSASLVFGFTRSDGAKDTSTNKIHILEASLEEPWPTGTQPAFVSTTGNDSNDGLTAATAKATLSAAASAIGGVGPVIMQAGSYTNQTVNLSGATNLRIIGQGVVKVYNGERVTRTSWSPYTAGGAMHTYRASVVTAIPASTFGIGVWVHEMGIPDGAIIAPANYLPRQGTHTVHRLDNKRIGWGSAANTLSSGQFFYGAGTLYLRASDDANLSTVTRDYWIPSQTPTKCLAHGAAPGDAGTNLTVENVQSYFGCHGVDVTGCTNYTFRNCAFIGNAKLGLLRASTGHPTTGLEDTCEYAANGTDGSGGTAYGGSDVFTVTVLNPWCHDNGDQGYSIHGSGNTATIVGGLFENNNRGGLLWVQGSSITSTDAHTRDNRYCGIGLGILHNGNRTTGSFTNWVSERDDFGAFVNGSSSLVLRRGTVRSPTYGYTFYLTQNAGDTSTITTYPTMTYSSPGPSPTVIGSPTGTITSH